MDNLLKIMSLKEEDMHRVIFVNSQKEGGFSAVYDPQQSQWCYQVFIHNSFPYKTLFSQEFSSFEEARRFAAKEAFRKDWEMLSWDQKVRRPCQDGGHECGSGSCEMCKTTGGGCKSCGATDDNFH